MFIYRLITLYYQFFSFLAFEIKGSCVVSVAVILFIFLERVDHRIDNLVPLKLGYSTSGSILYKHCWFSISYVGIAWWSGRYIPTFFIFGCVFEIHSQPSFILFNGAYASAANIRMWSFVAGFECKHSNIYFLSVTRTSLVLFSADLIEVRAAVSTHGNRDRKATIWKPIKTDSELQP